ncbi:MAG TPA: substrate-binding domain-containing protein [Actinoplanes sp.]|jgi:LacI family transcriptional regulator|nr:substrate-binding domain-containing protein [Actinoplanes sp.]
MPPKDGRTTLATVAASAGVSVATVSRVLNGRADVGPATRARVEALLRQHQYHGRRVASVIRSAATARIELLFASPLNAYSIEIMQGVLDAASDAGVAVAVSVGSDGERRSEARRAGGWARDLASAGRQAVVSVVNDLTADHLHALFRAHLPLVVIDPSTMPRARVASVGSTNFTGGLAAAQHLLSLGHRRIAYIGGPAAKAHSQARLHGYRAALEAECVPVPSGYVRTGRFLYQDGLVGAAALLDLPEPPTAVFAGSDETAAGVIEAARVRGLRVPDDLSVVGFDDTQVARYASPPLTTVRQPLRDMGRVALRTALRLAAGEKLDSHHVELATELVVRQSTGSAPPAGAMATA